MTGANVALRWDGGDIVATLFCPCGAVTVIDNHSMRAEDGYLACEDCGKTYYAAGMLPAIEKAYEVKEGWLD